MNANELIEAYVTDVARRLPKRQRDDVAFELRALLHEELAERAEGGRTVDAALATGLLREHGHPAEVAARYRTPVTVVDPADGRAFWRATVVGLALIWALGLAERLRQASATGEELLTTIGTWWGGTVLPSLWWPGVLVVGFGLAAWSRRRRPESPEWKPRAADHVTGGRVAVALGLVGILCGIFVLLDPRVVLDAFFGGRAAPAAYEALTYTESFRARQAPVLLALLLLQLPLLGAVLVGGRWSPRLRKLEVALALAMCAGLAWTVLDGPVFATPASDRMTKVLLTLIAIGSLVELGVRWYRSVRPAPRPGLQASR